MTREEQIKKAAKELVGGVFFLKQELLADSFIKGAEWADRHPYYNQEGFTEDMFVREQAFLDNWLDEHGSFPTFSDALEWERKRVVDKVVEWLENFLEKAIQKPSVNDGYTSETIECAELKRRRLIEEVLCDFKKAMEE